ncbi:TIGR03086 family metal-binding protein [Nocardia sp. NPDC050710]|uniref:TIGR03086 family metal-binding protein n=1 Tax=Nocardia sp. NPDC050710 TaxID=3157220 RepID=UPI0033C8A1D1
MEIVIGQIDRALDMTGKIVDAVDDGGLTASTPCVDWDVRTVLNHVVGGMHIFAAELSGIDPGGAHEDDWLGADPQAAYAAAAEIDRAAWHRPDVPTATVHIGLGALPAPAAALIHLTEVLVHGIDIAVAIDRPDLADDALSAELLTTMRDTDGIDAFRAPGVFGAEVAIAADAPAHRKLLAYVGRTR